ncbi:MAG: hypothetical protein JWL79_2111 [Frankiales bacterium]|nr:hypothetical protein [Frankiales bacterium]
MLEDFLNRAGIGQPLPDGGPRSRSVRRLTDSSCLVDYGEPDQVFLVSVQRIPRLHLGPDEPVHLGELGGLQVQLTAVTVDHEVAVHLQFEDDDRRRAQEGEDVAQRLATVTLTITDDLGTEYGRTFGRFGGSGTEFEGAWLFQPQPPAQARQLRVTAHAAGNEPAVVTLDLPTTSKEDPTGVG